MPFPGRNQHWEGSQGNKMQAVQKHANRKMLTLSLVIIVSGIGWQSCNNENKNISEPKDAAASVQSMLGRMTLDEKIGQMTQVDRGYLKSVSDISTYYLGSLLSGGGSAPADNSPAGWADMYDLYQTEALKTRLKIPLVYGIDAVHGHNNVIGAVIFPHEIGMGATHDPDLIRRANAIVAKEVAGTGIDWTFAPCLTVPQDEHWGRTYEGWSENSELVSQFAGAAVKGFQGEYLGAPNGILACAKHFAGDGGTQGGVDRGDTRLPEDEFRQIHISIYQAAIDAGVGSVMASYNSWNGQKSHGNYHLLTEILKNEMGFNGFIVSDWAGIDELPGDYRSDVEQSINAGIDMVMVPEHYQTFIGTLKELVNEGRVSMSRIDDAVTRILLVKYQMGLFEAPFTDRILTAQVGSVEHRSVAREAVKKSLVLLKNANNTLPLSKTIHRIHVAGKNANDMGNQCGGWTISWQGNSGDITQGTTILDGIKNTVSAQSVVTYSDDGSGAQDADIMIAVIGETPYAEMNGDRTDLHLAAEDVTVINNLKSTGKPVVVVLVSGRPLIITDELPEINALVAAWLPGTEGAGVADVLFGDYNPTGTLSVTWPRNMEQIPINYGDSNYDPLFAFGFGLTYSN